jgi:4-hydroxybenzoate polyprenyltransferase
MPSPETEQTGKRDLSAGADVSDLIGVKETLWLALWLLAAIVCFFLVGVVVGIIVVIVGTIATLALLVNAVRRADTSD